MNQDFIFDRHLSFFFRNGFAIRALRDLGILSVVESSYGITWYDLTNKGVIRRQRAEFGCLSEAGRMAFAPTPTKNSSPSNQRLVPLILGQVDQAIAILGLSHPPLPPDWGWSRAKSDASGTSVSLQQFGATQLDDRLTVWGRYPALEVDRLAL